MNHLLQYLWHRVGDGKWSFLMTLNGALAGMVSAIYSVIFETQANPCRSPSVPGAMCTSLGLPWWSELGLDSASSVSTLSCSSKCSGDNIVWINFTPKLSKVLNHPIWAIR